MGTNTNMNKMNTVQCCSVLILYFTTPRGTFSNHSCLSGPLLKNVVCLSPRTKIKKAPLD